MKIYNKEKTEVLENPNLELGYLKEDKLVLKVVPAQAEVPEQFHYEYNEYKNEKGEVYGRDRIKIVDKPYQPAIEEHEETENIKVYILYTEEEILEKKKQRFRDWREKYFKVIDRAVWFDCLSETDKNLVRIFRTQLLNITETLQYPEIPECVSKEVKEA